MEISYSDIETIILSCKQGNHKRLNLTFVYCPPTGNLNAALDTLSDNISESKSLMSGNLVIVGDFNVDLLNPNVHSRQMEQFVNLCNVNQLIQGPTHITFSFETLIDQLYSSAPHVAHTGTICCDISDHLLIVVVLKKIQSNTKKYTGDHIGTLIKLIL